MQHISEIVSIFALMISLFAFLENRRNNRIGLAPTLIGHEKQGLSEYSYSIQNKGRGPAYFTKVEYFLDQKPLNDTSLRDAIAKMLAEHAVRANFSVTHPAQQNVMQPGEELMLAKIGVIKEDAEKFAAIPSGRIAVRITFKSGHGKKAVWASDDRLA